MSAKIKKEFKADDAEATKKQFVAHLGSDNEWFSDLLYDIKINYINKGSSITDILIRQSQAILLTVVRPSIIYSPPKPKDGGKRRHPTDQEIKEIVTKFYDKAEDRSWQGFICDFSFSVEGLGIYRVNYSNSANGSVLSIRILSYELPNFGFVRYPKMYQDFIHNLVGKTEVSQPNPQRGDNGEVLEMVVKPTNEVSESGLILHVGPTGSGKTTGIAAEFGFLAENTSVKMVTFENPIEYRYVLTKAPVEQYELGVNVVEEGNRKELEVAQRLFLRATASVALIGEARNNDEIKILVDIASRGHLVFSTVHAMNVYEAISNLVDAVGDGKQLLSQSLKAVVAHKLIRSKKGEVHGIHEIVIISAALRSFIAKGDMQSIKRIIQQESQGIQRQTFEESLTSLERDGKITFAEKSTIMENNAALFSGQDAN